MKLKFKHQRFQLDATKAVTDVFKGQSFSNGLQFIVDQGNDKQFFDEGFGNQHIDISEEQLLENLRSQQIANGLPVSEHLNLNDLKLTIEMETGTGKTYTYIRTMFELNKLYGWCKFIVVVPSIAIREGVVKSFEVMQDHFAQEYGKRIQFFEYDSKHLKKIDAFASDNNLHVMIINTQAFNARGADARRIYMELDEFQSRKPINVIAQTHPILIIDEPQTVLGSNKKNATREKLTEFNALFTLLYSATHREVFNMVYRLDAMDAYNKKLVKKIAVKGVEQIGTTGTNGFIYLEDIEVSKEDYPRARLSFEQKTKNGIKRVTKWVDEGFNLYERSGELVSYENNFIVSTIDGADRFIAFNNGLKLPVGGVIGAVHEEALRRIQIRETIQSHFETERKLFERGIKVLSLFFIDHVANYRQYKADGTTSLGTYAKIFEEEYAELVEEQLSDLVNDPKYKDYLKKYSAEQVHAGYFSKDKKGHFKDSKLGVENKEDSDTFTLIMKDKERLLSFDEPVRFIFSHSALKEGWDNPNVFQICTLKNSDNETKKRQEVGRGMRLCVNQRGERQDGDALGNEGVHDVNVLTIIASESYDDFAKKLQTEIAEAVTTRPKHVNAQLFTGLKIKRNDNTSFTLTTDQSEAINDALLQSGYRKKTALTSKFYEDVAKKTFALDLLEDFGEDAATVVTAVQEALNSVFNTNALRPVNARKLKDAKFRNDKFNKEFKELWDKISAKTFYTVDFKADEFITSAINHINEKLEVSIVHIKVSSGSMSAIDSKEALETGKAMTKQSEHRDNTVSVVGAVKYDLIGKLVETTSLTRKVIVQILSRIRADKFELFKKNPEEFIIKVSNLINETKAFTVIQHIAYKKLDKTYETSIFTEASIRGEVGVNAIKSTKSLYDLVVVDSLGIEKNFVENLEKSQEVVVYTKLPRGFYINTPVGRYNPDWAIVFDGEVKHVYFIAETKGSNDSAQLRPVEQTKIECARKHFKAISSGSVIYDVVTSYDQLYQKVMQ